MSWGNQIIGKGTTLGYADTDVGTPVNVAEIINVPMPNTTVAKVRTSHYGTTGEHHTHAPGWADTADLQVTAAYTKAGLAAVRAIRGLEKHWTLTLKDTSTWKFTGWVSSIGGEVPMEDRVTATLQIVVTSDPVFAPAS